MMEQKSAKMNQQRGGWAWSRVSVCPSAQTSDPNLWPQLLWESESASLADPDFVWLLFPSRSSLGTEQREPKTNLVQQSSLLWFGPQRTLAPADRPYRCQNMRGLMKSSENIKLLESQVRGSLSLQLNRKKFWAPPQATNRRPRFSEPTHPLGNDAVLFDL